MFAAAELRLGVGKNRFVSIHWNAGRLICARPVCSARDIAQVTEAAPVIARDVFPPARHRHVAQAAVAPAGGCQHQVVAAVGEHLQRGWRSIGRSENAQSRLTGVRL